MNKQELYDKHLELISKGNKEETEKWILSLSDKEFNILTTQPFIIQAKIHYKKLREKIKNKL